MFFFCFSDEILGRSQCVWFSPDSKRLLFSTFNDSNVGLVSFKEFDTNPGSMTGHFSEDHAPYDMSVRYSKVQILDNSSIELMTYFLRIFCC